MSGADPWSEFRQRADVWADFRPPVAAAKPEPGFLRGVGLGVRDAAQGLLAVPGMAYDAVGGGINLLSGGLEAIGGPSLPRIRTARENIDAVADTAGFPKPATADEKLNSAIVQNMAATLPTIGVGAVMQGANVAPRAAQMLAGNIPSQLAGAAGAGYVGELASQADWHPAMQFGAALGPCCSRSARRDGNGWPPMCCCAVPLILKACRRGWRRGCPMTAGACQTHRSQRRRRRATPA